MVIVKEETKKIIDTLTEITGQEEDQVVNKSIEQFFKKYIQLTGMMSILGFGVFHHALCLLNQ